MGKIFVNDIPNKGLISKIYKKLIHLNIKQTNPNPWLKNGHNSWIEIFLNKKNTDSQQAHEKMLNITNHQSNENQNHNKIPPYTCQNGYHQKPTNNKCWQRYDEIGTLVHCL